MDVGYLILCASDGWNDVTDAQVYREEVELARMADDLGFSVIWAVEHHFDGYSFVPDNALMAAHLAATCKNADVGTAAFILPWHDPLRVAERITMLDHLTDGRLRIGFGRGAARMEFNGFREGSMDESRDRFNESIDIILRALETGIIEGDGPFYKQPPTPLRPKPERSFKGRIYSVANSEDSLKNTARLGARLMMPADKSWRSRMPGIEMYREMYKDLHREDAPRPLCTDYTVCTADADKAHDMAFEYLGGVLDSSWRHYEFKGDHFAIDQRLRALRRQCRCPPANGPGRVPREDLPGGLHLGDPRSDPRAAQVPPRHARRLRDVDRLPDRRLALRGCQGVAEAIRHRGTTSHEDVVTGH